jgi:hypothetical protein
MNVRNVPNSRLMATLKERVPKAPTVCSAAIRNRRLKPSGEAETSDWNSAPLDRIGAVPRPASHGGVLPEGKPRCVKSITSGDAALNLSFDIGQTAKNPRRLGERRYTATRSTYGRTVPPCGQPSVGSAGGGDHTHSCVDEELQQTKLSRAGRPEAEWVVTAGRTTSPQFRLHRSLPWIAATTL